MLPFLSSRITVRTFFVIAAWRGAGKKSINPRHLRKEVFADLAQRFP
jgi:hypothetical protein